MTMRPGPESAAASVAEVVPPAPTAAPAPAPWSPYLEHGGNNAVSGWLAQQATVEPKSGSAGPLPPEQIERATTENQLILDVDLPLVAAYLGLGADAAPTAITRRIEADQRRGRRRVTGVVDREIVDGTLLGLFRRGKDDDALSLIARWYHVPIWEVGWWQPGTRAPEPSCGGSAGEWVSARCDKDGSVLARICRRPTTTGELAAFLADLKAAIHHTCGKGSKGSAIA